MLISSVNFWLLLFSSLEFQNTLISLLIILFFKCTLCTQFIVYILLWHNFKISSPFPFWYYAIMSQHCQRETSQLLFTCSGVGVLWCMSSIRMYAFVNNLAYMNEITKLHFCPQQQGWRNQHRDDLDLIPKPETQSFWLWIWYNRHCASSPYNFKTWFYEISRHRETWHRM